jgi:hypothetical protein
MKALALTALTVLAAGCQEIPNPVKAELVGPVKLADTPIKAVVTNPVKADIVSPVKLSPTRPVGTRVEQLCREQHDLNVELVKAMADSGWVYEGPLYNNGLNCTVTVWNCYDANAACGLKL